MRLAGGWVTCTALVAVAAVQIAAAGVAQPTVASGATDAAGGRVFTLFTDRTQDPLLQLAAGAMTVGPDHTVYWQQWTDEVVALRPGRLRQTRVIRSGQGPLDQFESFTGIAATPDGALLLASYNNRVWRRAPDGTVAPIAGDGRPGLSGDGGPASAAQVCRPSAIAALPHGGFVFADQDGALIRRVDADGQISTLFAVDPTSTGGCPGDSASRAGARDVPPGPLPLQGLSVVELAAGPDGQVAMVLQDRGGLGYTDQRLEYVAADGRRQPLATDHQFGGLAIASNGSVIAAATEHVLSWPSPETAPNVVMQTTELSVPMFDGDGTPAARYQYNDVGPRPMGVAPDGGLVGVISRSPDITEPPRLIYVAPAHPTRTAVALSPQHGRATAHAYTARVLTTTPATATLTVLHGRRRLARRTASLSAGWHTLAARGRLPPVTATVRVDVVGPTGQRATDQIRLVVGDRLPAPPARDALRRYLCEVGDDGRCANPGRLDLCRRLSATRVDCRYMTFECRAGTARLTSLGAIRVRRYARCPRPGAAFPAHPRYSREPGFERWLVIGPPQEP